jgi:hypothetical protein
MWLAGRYPDDSLQEAEPIIISKNFPSGLFSGRQRHKSYASRAHSIATNYPSQVTKVTYNLAAEKSKRPARMSPFTRGWPMAGSSKPGSQFPPYGMCKVPPRTPGILGILDQSDPNTTALFGDTPGTLGVRDWADPSPRQCTSLLFFPLLAPSLKDEIDLLVPAPEYVPLKDVQLLALKITTSFESGRNMDYQALADDFDGQGTSFGLIQWNFGQGTLGPLLKKMLDKDEKTFAGCFGADADYETLKIALKKPDVAAELKWARDLLKKNREAWKSAFQKIGTNETFQGIQLDAAVSQFHPLAVKVIANLRTVSPTLFAHVEVRSYVAIYDLCVQQGGVYKALDKIRSRVTKEKPTTQLELMKIVVTERGLMADSEWVSDCISRRMGILTGSKYKSSDGDNVATRDNANFGLLAGTGAKLVEGL